MKNQGTFQTLRHTMIHTVLKVRFLTESTFVVRCSRGGLSFKPGQHLSVGPKNDLNMREYSVYSGDKENYLDILVKEVKEGLVSKELKRLKPKEEIKIEGPFGFFVIEEHEKKKPLYMIATGTGISPFHCFAISYPALPFTVLHGVRYTSDLYDKDIFFKEHILFIPCISSPINKADKSDKIPNVFHGRVTEYLKAQTIDTEGIYFLCGNCDMIYEVFDILQQNGVAPEQIKAEVYF